MPLNHQDRIALDRRTPRIVQLWFALQGLKSCVRFMQTGAHPDDEISSMLAALSFREGFGVSYACAVRGEGGQNDIGPELIHDLGVLRTAEMERAADVLDMNLYWLSETPEDSIFDFGFSKDGKDTLARWDQTRVLTRLVEIVRTERPDILCPTFLDIPGQHGHHRAMTEAVGQVFEAAADPAYPVNLPVWEVSKLYLPAWSGAGGSYDDEVPPPPATLTVEVTGEDAVTGWTWERIGQMSRGFHRTQGMGRWMPAGAERDRRLHLWMTRVEGKDETLVHGLPTLDQLGEPVARALNDTVAAFPDGKAVAKSAMNALHLINEGMNQTDPSKRHLFQRKELELARVIRIAAGVEVFGYVANEWLCPGDLTELTVEKRSGIADEVSVTPGLPGDWRSKGACIGPNEGANGTDPYPAEYKPLEPRAPALAVSTRIGGQTSASKLPLLVPPVVVPGRRAELSVDRTVVNTATSNNSIDVSVAGVVPEGAQVVFQLPSGWRAKSDGANWHITTPENVKEGRYDFPVFVGGKPAQTVRRIQYPHVDPRARAVPANLSVLVMNAELPKVRIGYIGAGNDRVCEWLAAMGAEVVDLSGASLERQNALDGIDTLVVGIFAMRFRDGLRQAMSTIHDWIENGGTLLTLYHRPWDDWDPDTVPPRRLEIGQPSLRWRVTDENAAVTHLSPDHALLTQPNAIAQADWQDWRKERGLYFAKSWDHTYQPLLEMADPGEDAHRGSLLCADVGRGRHIHCALILHHQLDELKPGAFRILANLVSKRTHDELD